MICFLEEGSRRNIKGRRKDEQKRRKEVKKEAKGKRNKEKTVEKSYRRRAAINQRGRGKVVAQPTSRLRSRVDDNPEPTTFSSDIALTNLCTVHIMMQFIHQRRVGCGHE